MIKNIFKREKKEKEPKIKEKVTMKDLIRAIVLTTPLAVFLFGAIIVGPCYGDGPSMEPTMKDGGWYSCNYFYKKSDLEIGKIVIFIMEKEIDVSYTDYEGNNKVSTQVNESHPNLHDILCKRIVAGPGDVVSIKDGLLYVNGELSEYQFDKMNYIGLFNICKEMKLGEDEWLLMGDNRNNSEDSRRFGPIKTKHIKGIIRGELF